MPASVSVPQVGWPRKNMVRELLREPAGLSLVLKKIPIPETPPQVSSPAAPKLPSDSPNRYLPPPPPHPPSDPPNRYLPLPRPPSCLQTPPQVPAPAAPLPLLHP